MEIFNLIFGIIIFGIVFCIELFLYRKSPTKEEVEEYQEILNENNMLIKIKYDLDFKHDSFTEIMRGRNQKKGFLFIFVSIMIAFSILIFDVLTINNIAIMATSAIFLIIYGIMKMAESKIMVMLLLILVLIIGAVMISLFNELIMSYNYTYHCMCIGLLIMILFIFLRQK